MDKKIYVIVADVDLFYNTRGELERIEGETLNIEDTTQFMSGKIHKHLCDMWEVKSGDEQKLTVYPIYDFTQAFNCDDLITTNSFIAYVML